MTNWKELGEVPDSEGEDDFGSDYDDLDKSQDSAQETPRDNNELKNDIYDFPDSDNDIDDAHAPRPLRTKSTSPAPIIDSVDSSPLSSPPSESDLPQVDELLHDYPGFEQTPSPAPARSVKESPAKDDSSTERPASPLAGEDEERHQPPLVTLDDDAILQDAQVEAELIALRYERSLRPRKPIQEHPYLLENAHYSTLLGKHGVRPLRIAQEAERRRRENQQQDTDYEAESQDTGPPRGLPSSQPNGGSDVEMLGQDDLPTSSPLNTSSLRNRTVLSSQDGSQADTDDTSMGEQDLPELKDLLRRPRKMSKGRKALKKAIESFDAKKRSRANALHDKSRQKPRTQESRQQSPKSPSLLPDRDPEDGPDVAALNRLGSPVFKDSMPLSGHEEMPVNVIPDDSSDAPAENKSPTSHSENEGSNAENPPNQMSSIGRRIRGVLPASWLRLDQHAARDKAAKTLNRRNRDRSPDRQMRRGVAQLRRTMSASHRAALIPDDSDEDLPAALDPSTARPSFEPEQRNMFEYMMPSANSRAPPDDDAESVIEDDHIDRMFVGRKRQQKLDALQGVAKKQKTYKDSRGYGQPQPRRQNNPTGSSSSRRPGRSRKPRSHSSSKSAPRRSGGKRQQVLRHPDRPPPQLSILDVMESEAPRFVKIAARAARRRANQGRSSPGRKNIQLATRRDHVDAASVLDAWRAGSIGQRAAVTKRRSEAKPRQMRRPLEPVDRETTNRHSPVPLSQPNFSSQKPQKLVRQVSSKGTVSYKRGDRQRDIQNVGNPEHEAPNFARPAQLEVDESSEAANFSFQMRKRFLDRLYQSNRRPASSVGPEQTDGPPAPTHFIDSSEHADAELGAEHNTTLSRKSRYRKKTKPRHLDIELPQYSHANDPLPASFTPAPSPPPDITLPQNEVEVDRSTLKHLGPYGTEYTLHFEVFPLEHGIYFHESTLIGSGVIEECKHPEFSKNFLQDTRPRVSFDLENHALRWGPWNEQTSSEFGILLDFVAENLEQNESVDAGLLSKALNASTFAFEYIKNSLTLEADEVKPFVTRLKDVLQSCHERIHALNSEGDLSESNIILKIYDRLLLISFIGLRICRDDPSFMAEHLQLEGVFVSISKAMCQRLFNGGVKQLRQSYDSLASIKMRERGVREDAATMHSWVLLMKLLEHASIPRATVWGIMQEVLATPQALSSNDVQGYERMWEALFTTLPLVEFNDAGIVISGKRQDVSNEGWQMPQKIVKHVFDIYKKNKRQPPGFIHYCRAMIGRCHYLIQQWGWRRASSMIGVIFDFFGSQDLAHLRNEEAYKSPRFLEELAHDPKLDVEAEDKCFHIFLKMVAMSIKKLRAVGSRKDVSNLVMRTLPNHNRQHLKEQNVHERDLAALRNHHDLLGTLFWASPPEARPSLQLIERLVDPETSHKEACLINLRAWSQLARFTVATGEATTSFRSMSQWRNTFFQKILHQFDSVVSDIHHQLKSMSNDMSNSISEDVVNAMISMNKSAAMDVLHLSVTSSLDVMRHAPDLEAANFSLNLVQLQQIFKRFATPTPELDWPILRSSLASLEEFLNRIDVFKENNDSQESESQILNSAQVDDAVLTIDHDLARAFFSMARNALRAPKQGESPVLASERSQGNEQIVRLAARLGSHFIKGGLTKVNDMFKPGKYCLFSHAPHDLDLENRMYLVLFLTVLVKSGLDDFGDIHSSLLDLWMTALVKPRSYLRYEGQLGEQIRRLGKEFVPDSILGLATSPDYSINRDLFEFTASAMRTMVREAGPWDKKAMVAEHSKSLKLVMEQMKEDLRTIASNDLEHPGFVNFVREVVSLIRTHGSDFTAVDEFFYQISKEYSPPAQDPQLQVAGMLSYGLRLAEDEARLSHQLFFFLFNNFKMAMVSNKLHGEVSLLRRGMGSQNILQFVLGKMLPAVVRAAFKEPFGFVMVDVYVEALNEALRGKAAPRELVAEDLPGLTVLLRAIAQGLDGLRHTNHSDLSQVHLIRQLFAAMNVVWPHLRSLWVSGEAKPETELFDLLRDIKLVATAVQEEVEEATENEGVDVIHLVSASRTAAGERQPFDTYVNSFTNNIAQDIANNWVVSSDKMTIQAPNRARGSGGPVGLTVPSWDERELTEDLYERTREWTSWWDEVCGGSLRREHWGEDAPIIVF